MSDIPVDIFCIRDNNILIQATDKCEHHFSLSFNNILVAQLSILCQDTVNPVEVIHGGGGLLPLGGQEITGNPFQSILVCIEK